MCASVARSRKPMPGRAGEINIDLPDDHRPGASIKMKTALAPPKAREQPCRNNEQGPQRLMKSRRTLARFIRVASFEF
jgi:hypothetical protein